MKARPASGLALALVVGCAPAQTSSAGGAGAAPASDASLLEATFERVVAPFEVRDATGKPYDHPFLGGFIVPRPQLVDIDGDGDLDLFVQERTGELMHFENTGTATEPSFVWRTDRFQDLDIGEWSRLHDLDGDGLVDVFAETRYSYARYYRNVGTMAEPRFELLADSLRDADGRPIFADRQNIPALADVDCNGLTDLFLGRVDGTVARYEEIERGGGPDGAPRFTLRSERFEDIEIVAQIGMPSPNGAPDLPTRHGANSMAFGDVDADGDPDLLWGDYFEPGVLLIENRGTCARPNLRSEPVPVPATELVATSGYNAPFLADLDADGDPDLLVGVLGGAFNANLTASDNLHFYERLDDGRVTLRTTRFLSGLDVGSESAPAFADLDGDGDMDLLVGNKLDPATPGTARLYRFENVGSAAEPRFVLADTASLVDAYHYTPALADLTGDGRPELLLGTWNEGVYLYRDEGDGDRPRWTPASSEPLLTLPRGSHSAPAAGDLDGDGRVDVVVGEASGELNYFRNVGTPVEPAFELVTERLSDIDAGRRSAPTLVDLDGDGRLDLVVGREDTGLLVYLNRGVVDGVPVFEAADTLRARVPGLAQPVFVDLDADGRLELVSGVGSGGLVQYQVPAGR